MDTEAAFDAFEDRLDPLGFESKGDVKLTLDLENRLWQSPYAFAMAVVISDPTNVEQVREEWLEAQYFLDLTLSKLDDANSYFDATLVLLMDEMPDDPEMDQLVWEITHDTTVCAKMFVTPEDQRRWGWFNVHTITALDWPETGPKEVPTTYDVADVTVPLTANVTVLHGFNSTRRHEIFSFMRDHLSYDHDIAFFDRPFRDMDPIQRVWWVHELRAAMLLHPERKCVINTPLRQVVRLMGERFHRIERDPLIFRAIQVDRGLNRVPKLTYKDT